MFVDQVVIVHRGIVGCKEQDPAGNHFIFRVIDLPHYQSASLPALKSIVAYLQTLRKLPTVSSVYENLAHLRI